MSIAPAAFLLELGQIDKQDFKHFRFSKQQTDGTNRLARYDFLLVFHSHVFVAIRPTCDILSVSDHAQKLLEPNAIQKCEDSYTVGLHIAYTVVYTVCLYCRQCV